MKIIVEESINAPINKVFEAFSDVSNIENRISGIKKVEILSKTKSGLGTKWRETREFFGKEATEDMEITLFESPSRYEIDAASHGSKYHSDITFAEENGETIVRQIFSATPVSILAKLMTPIAFIFRGSTKKALQADFQDLKKCLES